MLRHLRLSMGISSLSPSKILPLQKNKHPRTCPGRRTARPRSRPAGHAPASNPGRESGVRAESRDPGDPHGGVPQLSELPVLTKRGISYVSALCEWRGRIAVWRAADEATTTARTQNTRARHGFSAGSFETPDIPDYVVAELRYEKPVAFTTSGFAAPAAAADDAARLNQTRSAFDVVAVRRLRHARLGGARADRFGGQAS